MVENFLSKLCQALERSRLESSEPLKIKHVEPVLSAMFGASVDFLRPDGRKMREDKAMLKVLREGEFELRVRIKPMDEVPEMVAANDEESTVPAVTSSQPSRPIDPLFVRLIAALDAQERRRDFVWAGYVVNDILPRLGADKARAQVVFDELVDSGVLTLEKRPNPNNPDFKTTCVKLNHEHEMVGAALKGNGAVSRPFEPVPIRGEPLSTTIIRERR